MSRFLFLIRDDSRFVTQDRRIFLMLRESWGLVTGNWEFHYGKLGVSLRQTQDIEKEAFFLAERGPLTASKWASLYRQEIYYAK